MTLRSFLTRAPKTMTNLQTAYDAKDFAKMRRDAHSLKGACGYVASEHLRESSLSLQLAAEAATRGEVVDPPLELCMQEVLQRLDLLCVTIEKVIAAGSEPKAAAPGVTPAPAPPPAPAWIMTLPPAFAAPLDPADTVTSPAEPLSALPEANDT